MAGDAVQFALSSTYFFNFSRNISKIEHMIQTLQSIMVKLETRRDTIFGSA